MGRYQTRLSHAHGNLRHPYSSSLSLHVNYENWSYIPAEMKSEARGAIIVGETYGKQRQYLKFIVLE